MASSGKEKAKVLMNIPYSDQWYIPGGDSYMSRLVSDAVGEVLGARAGEIQSRVVSLEEAYILSGEADVWLHPGWCTSRKDISSLGPLFSRISIPIIYNHTLRTTPGGGNDFWESGAFRCDLILEDLSHILSSSSEEDLSSLNYYLKIE